MTHREFAVLEAVNIASTQYKLTPHTYEATAAQIAHVHNTDERLIGAWPTYLDSRQVGETLKALGSGWPTRPTPLVEKVSTRRWRLTKAGVDVLCA